MSLLAGIQGPADLKRLRRDQLPQLAQEIRERLIEACSVTGGHIGASLGPPSASFFRTAGGAVAARRSTARDIPKDVAQKRVVEAIREGAKFA